MGIQIVYLHNTSDLENFGPICQVEDVNPLDKHPTLSINTMCGLSRLSWDFILV